jgi:flagella basal body P-ring formation protein FlgA
MKRLIVSATLSYALMGLWLVLVMAVPARAEGVLAPTRLADHADTIRAALIAEGAPADAALSLAAPDAEVRVAEDGALLIETVSYNRASGRFLIRARGAPGEPLIAISGAAAASVTLPVPARDIPRGGVVGEEDVDFVEVIDAGAARFIDDADAIIGKEARRALVKGAPLKVADLRSTLLIKRGASVTVVLEAPGLRLTQIASALENGGEGDLIAFRNVTSGAEIKAIVKSPTLAAAPLSGASQRHAAVTE